MTRTSYTTAFFSCFFFCLCLFVLSSCFELPVSNFRHLLGIAEKEPTIAPEDQPPPIPSDVKSGSVRSDINEPSENAKAPGTDGTPINTADLKQLQDTASPPAATALPAPAPTPLPPVTRSQQVGRWELPALKMLEPVGRHEAEIVSLFMALSKPETAGRALSVDSEGNVLLWDIVNSSGYRIMKLPRKVEKAAFLPELGWLAVSEGNLVEIYSLSERKPLFALTRLRTRITALAFQPKGESIIIGAADGRVYRWKYFDEQEARTIKERRKILERYIGHGSVISSVAFHPFGRAFFSADWRGQISAWLTHDTDIFQGRYDENLFGDRIFSGVAVRSAVAGSDQGVTQILLSSDGRYLYTATNDGKVGWWLVRGLKKLTETQAHKSIIYELAAAPDGQRLISSGREGKVKVWQLTLDKSDSLKSTIVQALELDMPDIRVLQFIGPEKVVAGNSKGQVFEFKPEASPTPAPTSAEGPVFFEEQSK